MARFAIRTLEFDKVKNMMAAKAATALGKEAVLAQQIESDFKKSSSTGNEMIDELLRTADDFLRNADIDAQTIEEVKQLISYIKKKNYEFVLNGKKSLSVDIESPDKK